MRIGKRNLPGLAAMLALILMILFMGIDLLDGEISLKRVVVSAAGTPVRFWFTVFCWAIWFAGLGAAWYFIIRGRRQVPRTPWKPTYDDPSRRSR